MSGVDPLQADGGEDGVLPEQVLAHPAVTALLEKGAKGTLSPEDVRRANLLQPDAFPDWGPEVKDVSERGGIDRQRRPRRLGR